MQADIMSWIRRISLTHGPILVYRLTELRSFPFDCDCDLQQWLKSEDLPGKRTSLWNFSCLLFKIEQPKDSEKSILEDDLRLSTKGFIKKTFRGIPRHSWGLELKLLYVRAFLELVAQPNCDRVGVYLHHLAY